MNGLAAPWPIALAVTALMAVTAGVALGIAYDRYAAILRAALRRRGILPTGAHRRCT